MPLPCSLSPSRTRHTSVPAVATEPQATVGPLLTEPRPGRPAPSAAPRHCQRLCPPAPALPGAAGTRRSFNPPLATTPIPGLPPVGPPTLPHPPALVGWHHSRWLPVAAVSVAFPRGKLSYFSAEVVTCPPCPPGPTPGVWLHMGRIPDHSWFPGKAAALLEVYGEAGRQGKFS